MIIEQIIYIYIGPFGLSWHCGPRNKLMVVTPLSPALILLYMPEAKKDGPRPVTDSDTLYPAVHILET